MEVRHRELKASGESVWDYPRPPRLEPSQRRIEVIHGGQTIARSTDTFRVLETSHPPVYYVPRGDVEGRFLTPAGASSHCEFKGQAEYYHLVMPRLRVERVAWSYLRPTADFQAIAGFLAFYPSKVDECRVDGERVAAQPGDFYGGWITRDVVGPFKGGPGTLGW